MDYLFSKSSKVIDGCESVTDMVKLSKINGKNVYLYIDKGIDDISYLKDLSAIVRNNNVFLILDSLNVDKDTIKLLAISSLVVYENYNIYVLDGEELTKEYLSGIVDNKVSRVDFRMYVDKCLDSLMHLVDDLDVMDLDDKASTIGKVHIKNMLGLYGLDLIGTYKKQIEQLQSKIAELQTARPVEKVESIIGTGVKLKEYTTLNINMYNNNLKGVLYFKEYTNVMYINSLIEYYIQLLVSDKYKQDVKLIVFDNLNDLNTLYDGFKVVVGDHIDRDLDVYLDADKLLITDRSTATLDIILKSLKLQDHIIIIYDRMHGIKDMVIGGNVVKYSLFSGKGSYDKISHRYKSVEFGTNIISNRFIINDGIILKSISEFSNLAPARKLAAYSKYKCMLNNKDFIIYNRFNSDLGLSF